jgi:hypothetical protein
MANINMFRTISGEDVIAEFLDVDGDGNHVYKNAIQLVVVPSQENSREQKFGLAQFPHYSPPKSDAKIRFNPSLIAFYIDVDEHLLDQYNTIFGHIVAPSPKIILGR